MPRSSRGFGCRAVRGAACRRVNEAPRFLALLWGWFLHDGLIRSLWHLAHAAQPEGVSSLNPTVAINPHPAHSPHLSWGGPRAIPPPPHAGPPYVGTHSSSRKRRRRKALGCSWLMLFMLRSLWGRRHSQISHSAACTE